MSISFAPTTALAPGRDLSCLLSPGEPALTLAERFDQARPAWQRDGACREHPDISWFPSGEDSAPAKAICETCLVQTECLAQALADAKLVGIWGGTSTGERRAMRRGAPHLERRREPR